MGRGHSLAELCLDSEEEFLHGKGGQALEGAAQGSGGARAHLPVVPGLFPSLLHSYLHFTVARREK